jgi:hypothetical protein
MNILFYCSSTVDETGNRFPCSLADAETYSGHVRMAWGIPGMGSGFFELPAQGREGLRSALADAVRYAPMIGTCRVFSVHPRRFLMPLMRWVCVQHPELQYALGMQVVDLVEEFYSPAILTYEERKNFNPQLVRNWMGEAFPPPDSLQCRETRTLWSLAEASIPNAFAQ